MTRPEKRPRQQSMSKADIGVEWIKMKAMGGTP